MPFVILALSMDNHTVQPNLYNEGRKVTES